MIRKTLTNLKISRMGYIFNVKYSHFLHESVLRKRIFLKDVWINPTKRQKNYLYEGNKSHLSDIMDDFLLVGSIGVRRLI